MNRFGLRQSIDHFRAARSGARFVARLLVPGRERPRRNRRPPRNSENYRYRQSDPQKG